MRRRKAMGLDSDSYAAYHHTLCLAEIDSRRMVHRFIPAIDYDEEENQLGVSTLLTDGSEACLGGIKAEWFPINGPETHEVVRTMAKFFFPHAG